MSVQPTYTRRQQQQIDLPESVTYWLTNPLEHDGHFVVGPETGPRERIGVVKPMLRGYSLPLRVLLGTGPLAAKGDVYLPDVNPWIFKTFLRCAYGVADAAIGALSFDESLDFLIFVDYYLAYEFKDKVCKHLATFFSTGFSLEKYFKIILTPVSCNEKSLRKALSKFTSLNAAEILSSELILQVDANTLLFIVKKTAYDVNAGVIWDTIIEWAKFALKTEDVDVLKKTLKEHIEQIKFGEMTPDEFRTKVISKGILSENKINSICNNLPVPLFYKVLEDKKSTFEVSFSHTVNNVSSFRGLEFSQDHQLKHLLWFIFLRKSFVIGGELSLFIGCKSKKETDELWKVKLCKMELLLINHCGKDNISRKFKTEKVLEESASDWGWHIFCSWAELVVPSKGFIKDDSVTVKAVFTVDYNV